MSKNIPKYLIIHHSASSRDNTTLENIDQWHKLRWPDFKSSLGFWVGYHYVITHLGLVQTRKDDEEGAHCNNDGMNQRSIGICLTGNFEEEEPSQMQIDLLRDLIKKLTTEYSIPPQNILGHGEVKGAKTLCPGKNLNMSAVRLMEEPVSNYEVNAKDTKKQLQDLLTQLTSLIGKL